MEKLAYEFGEAMFLGDRITSLERVIPAAGAAKRDAALAALVQPQTDDLVHLLTSMDGLPTTIRRLDPPLHEFPDRADLLVQVAVAEANGKTEGV